MKIEWEGRTYDLDTVSVRLSESDQICSYTGCKTMSEWERLLADPEDPRFAKVVTSACWLMLTQGGQDVRLADLDIPFLRFYLAIAEGIKAEAAAAAQAAEADPTPAADLSGGTSPAPTTGSAG